MNLSLLDPFESDLPELLEDYLNYRVAKCIEFNRRGTLLAAGCKDGSCVIWDFETRSVMRILESPEHNTPVLSISWSRTGRQLLTCNGTRDVTVWDVESAKVVSTIPFQANILSARFHPKDPTFFLVSPLHSPPLIAHLGTHESYPLPAGDDLTSHPIPAVFGRTGRYVYLATPNGQIWAARTEPSSEDQVQVVPVTPANSMIRQLAVSRNGRFIVCNCSDRVVRLVEIDESLDGVFVKAARGMAREVRGRSPFIKEFSDVVTRAQWKAVCFSGNGEYVAAAAIVKGEHKIHVWSRAFGHLVRILDGPKDGVQDITWHPIRPVAVSASVLGVVFVWAKEYTQNWSAFAPEFKETTENEEYVEREDEFDVFPDTEGGPQCSEEAAGFVDIETVDKVGALSHSEDSEDDIFFPTVQPDRQPASTGWEASENDDGNPDIDSLSSRYGSRSQSELKSSSTDSHERDFSDVTFYKERLDQKRIPKSKVKYSRPCKSPRID